jgi:hypothetical protein
MLCYNTANYDSYHTKERAVQRSIELDDALYNALEAYARTIGTTPEDLARHLLRKQVFLGGSANSDSFERNLEAFYRLLPELLKEYKGCCVAFRDGELVGVGTDRIALLKEMYARYGYSEILVTNVSDSLRVRHVGQRQLVRRQ